MEDLKVALSRFEWEQIQQATAGEQRNSKWRNNIMNFLGLKGMLFQPGF
jgi:hypothetical protein